VKATEIQNTFNFSSTQSKGLYAAVHKGTTSLYLGNNPLRAQNTRDTRASLEKQIKVTAQRE
jgi:hypothetical protein